MGYPHLNRCVVRKDKRTSSRTCLVGRDYALAASRAHWGRGKALRTFGTRLFGGGNRQSAWASSLCKERKTKQSPSGVPSRQSIMTYPRPEIKYNLFRNYARVVGVVKLGKLRLLAHDRVPKPNRERPRCKTHAQ